MNNNRNNNSMLHSRVSDLPSLGLLAGITVQGLKFPPVNRALKPIRKWLVTPLQSCHYSMMLKLHLAHGYFSMQTSVLVKTIDGLSHQAACVALWELIIRKEAGAFRLISLCPTDSVRCFLQQCIAMLLLMITGGKGKSLGCLGTSSSFSASTS